MKNYIQPISIVCLLLMTFSISAQVVPPRVNKFRFFTKRGKLITLQSKRYDISLKSEYHRYQRPIDTTLLEKGIFQILAEHGDFIEIKINRGKKKMEISTAVMLDSILFQEGKYFIPYQYQPLFEFIQSHGKTKIINQDLQYFEVSKFPRHRYYEETVKYSRDTLSKMDCKFWKNQRFRIPLREKPYELYGFYRDTSNHRLFMWNDDFGYVSKDNGRNWQQIPYPDDLEEKVMANRGKKQQQKNNYPVFTEREFDIKQLRASVNSPPLLTVRHAWYVKLRVLKNAWILSGQGYMLISNDKGKTWWFYITDNYNVEMLEIIDDTYLFNGYQLYRIR